MADQITDAEWAEFRQAIGDVFDTFADFPVTIRRRTTKLSATNQSRTKNNNTTDTILNAVLVNIGKDDDAQVRLSDNGSMDRSESYVLINYEVFAAAGLVDANGNHVLLEGKDSVIVKTKEYDIFGINQLGPADGQEAVVKIHLKKPVAPKVTR